MGDGYPSLYHNTRRSWSPSFAGLTLQGSSMEYPTTPTTWLIEPGKEVRMTVVSWTQGMCVNYAFSKVTHRHFQTIRNIARTNTAFRSVCVQLTNLSVWMNNCDFFSLVRESMPVIQTENCRQYDTHRSDSCVCSC